jgi:hypothetical protein
MRKSCFAQLAAVALLCAVDGQAASAATPDFTGIWGTYREPGAPPPVRGAARPALPLKPDAKAKVDAYHALVDPTGDTPGGHCLGTGMPGSMLGSGGYPMEIVQHDDLLLVVYEAHAEVRHIYLGERAKESDLFPDRNGYSFGRWEGDKLVVETTHLKEAVDQARFPHSDKAKIVEQYSLETRDDGSKVLTAEMTMTDPTFYTEPIKETKKWAYLPGVRLLPYECNEPAWEEHLERLRQGKAEDYK